MNLSLNKHNWKTYQPQQLPSLVQAKHWHLTSASNLPKTPSEKISIVRNKHWTPLIQWRFQDPKMKVLYHIRPCFVGIFPYIGLIYGRYLPFRILKFPLINKVITSNIAEMTWNRTKIQWRSLLVGPRPGKGHASVASRQCILGQSELKDGWVWAPRPSRRLPDVQM